MRLARHRRSFAVAVLAAAGLAAAAAVSAADGPPVEPPATSPATPPVGPPRPAAPQTAPAASPADQAAVDAAVANLTHADWRKRDQAQRDLVRLGDVAGPTLERVARATADDRVRSAARAALAQIADARFVGPSLVTLHLKDVPAKEAFEALAKQASTPLPAASESMWDDLKDVRVRLDADRQPFWTVMRELCKQTDVDLQEVNGQPRLVQGEGRRPGRAAVAGAFLVEATNLSRSQNVDLTADDAAPIDEQFGINFVARAEPRMTVLGMAPAVKLIEAVDEKGNSLAPEAPAAGADPGDAAAFEQFTAGGQRSGYDLYVPLRYPKNAGTRIARLRASVVFTIQLESKRIEHKTLRGLAGQSHVVNGVRVTFGAVTGGPEEYKLVLSVGGDSPLAAATWGGANDALLSRVKLLDAAGRPLEYRGYNTDFKAGATELTLEFGPGEAGGQTSGPPTRLAWDVPTRTRDVTVPFEFKDIRLP